MLFIYLLIEKVPGMLNGQPQKKTLLYYFNLLPYSMPFHSDLLIKIIGLCIALMIYRSMAFIPNPLLLLFQICILYLNLDMVKCGGF